MYEVMELRGETYDNVLDTGPVVVVEKDARC